MMTQAPFQSVYHIKVRLLYSSKNITSVDARWPSSVHDFCIFQGPLLGPRSEQGMANIHN